MQMLPVLLFALAAHLHRTFTTFAAEPKQLAFSPDSQTLATSCADGFVRLFRVADGKPLRILKHPAGVTSVQFSNDGTLIVTGSYDGDVRLWRTADGALVRVLRGHGGTVWSVAFSPDGRTIASSGEDKTARLWHTADG
ncbi:MAG TPA: hypothetical protein VI391_05725, partial [Thermoanaerobaculia bacterium]